MDGRRGIKTAPATSQRRWRLHRKGMMNSSSVVSLNLGVFGAWQQAKNT
jgi:hypothetical protein